VNVAVMDGMLLQRTVQVPPAATLLHPVVTYCGPALKAAHFGAGGVHTGGAPAKYPPSSKPKSSKVGKQLQSMIILLAGGLSDMHGIQAICRALVLHFNGSRHVNGTNACRRLDELYEYI
jgi:hypothetical protein